MKYATRSQTREPMFDSGWRSPSEVNRTCELDDTTPVKTCPQCRRGCEQSEATCHGCGLQFDKAPEKARAVDPIIGTVIKGSFRIVAKIGAGAMGAIYKADQLSLGRVVVIKLLHKHLLADENLLNRFQREAHAAARLKHPNTIDVIEFGQTESGALYIAMEYVSGQDLADVLHEQHPLGPTRIIRILKQVCLALDQAHEKGIIHRDLKPENIMLERRKGEPDFVKVLDFGIAKIQDPERKGDKWQTIAGLVCGTPEYMAPEQARGEPLDARADLYALGIILYQLLSNTLPFTGDSPISIVTKHLTDPVIPPSERAEDVHPGLEALALALLAKVPDGRPASAMAVFEALEAIEAETVVPTKTSGAFRVGTPKSPASPHDAETRMFDLHQTLRRPRSDELTASGGKVGRRRSFWIGAAAVGVLGTAVAVGLSLGRPDVSPAPVPVAASRTAAPVAPASGKAEAAPSLVASPAAVPAPREVAPTGGVTPFAGVGPTAGGEPNAVATERRTEDPSDTRRDKLPIDLVISRPAPIAAVAPPRPRTEPKPVEVTKTLTPPDAPKKPDSQNKPEASDADKAGKEAAAKEALARAEAARGSGQWDAAAAAYAQAYGLKPQGSLLKKMGYMYAKAGQTEQACKSFQRYVKSLSAEQRTDAVAGLAAYGCAITL